MSIKQRKRKRVVVEAAGLLGGNAGLERVFVSYVDMIADFPGLEVTAVVNSSAGSIIDALPGEVKRVEIRTPNKGSLYWARMKLGKVASNVSPSLWVSPATPAPKLPKCATVSVIHDLTFKRYPATMSFFARLYWAGFLPQAIVYDSRLVTVSNCIAQEIQKEWPQHAKKVCIVPNMLPENLREPRSEACPKDIDQRLRNWKQRGCRIVLAVGTLEPRKRPEDFVACAEKTKALSCDIRMVWVGREGWKSQQVAQRLIKNDRTLWVKDASDSQLVGLYSLADSFVSFSEYEGFGLPVIEAMQFGLPLILTDICSHREVAGDSAHYFAVGDVDSALYSMSSGNVTDSDYSPRLPKRYSREAVSRRLWECLKTVL